MAVNSFIGLPAAATLPIVSAVPILRRVCLASWGRFSTGRSPNPAATPGRLGRQVENLPRDLRQSERLLDFEVWPPDTDVAPKRIECCRRNFGE